jgi:diaminopimelate decarboxylase
MKQSNGNDGTWASFAPEAWGLDILPDGRLSIEGVDLPSLAGQFGTPLHVLNLARLRATADAAIRIVHQYGGGNSRVHYAMKANNLPAVITIMRESGLSVEVMTPFELQLAQHLGYIGEDIIVNGPYKTETFLHSCLEAGVRAIVVDSLQELHRLARIASERDVRVSVLFRVNPDFTPRHTNSGAATAGRSGSPFGLDLHGGEVIAALRFLGGEPRLRFLGLHLHIGTGLRHADEHHRAFRLLKSLVGDIGREGFDIDVIDVGGGFGVPTSREYTSMEMLISQVTGKLPRHGPAKAAPPFRDFVIGINSAVKELFGDSVPQMIFEPGRSLVSSSQLLLLRVEYVKQRPGVGTWLITDGGVGTVSLPTWYEYHEVFPCAGVRRRAEGKVHIVGPGCFAGDVVYRAKPMPAIKEREVLAVMDSGAYFLALESNFSHPRSAVVAVEQGTVSLLRRRESFQDMITRDSSF